MSAIGRLHCIQTFSNSKFWKTYSSKEYPPDGDTFLLLFSISPEQSWLDLCINWEVRKYLHGFFHAKWFEAASFISWRNMHGKLKPIFIELYAFHQLVFRFLQLCWNKFSNYIRWASYVTWFHEGNLWKTVKLICKL